MNSTYALLTITALGFSLPSAGAAAFRNLNFEEATIPPSFNAITPATAFPGWTVPSFDTTSDPYIHGPFTLYNEVTLGSPAQVLFGPPLPGAPGFVPKPLEGSFTAGLLWFGYSRAPALTQTGLIPEGTQYLEFLFRGGIASPRVTLDGQIIPLTPIDGGRLAGLISSFSGREATLSFTVPGTRDFAAYDFDDIRFSVPEAKSSIGIILGLFCLGLGRHLFPLRRN